MNLGDLCPICDEKLSIKDCVEVSKGINALTSASEKLKDGKSEKWAGKSKVTVHVVCRKEYTRADTIKAKLKRKQEEAECKPSTSAFSPVKKRLRDSQPAFDFKTMCLFCGNICDEVQEKKKAVHERRKICRVSTLELKDKIASKTDERGDDWGKQIKTRICAVSDLVAEEARYHSPCMVKFFKGTSKHETPGRPETEEVKSAFVKICDFMENSDDYQFSLKELVQITEEKITKKGIEKRLIEKYGDRILLSEIPYKDTIVCFRDVGQKILSEAWYQSKKEDENEERLRIVRTAAQIIKEDIIFQQSDVSRYPSPGTLLDDCEDSVPESLRSFLEEVIMKKKKGNLEILKRKCTVIAHTIMAAVRPRSFLSQVQLGLGLYLHNKFGSKLLLNILSSIGLSCSYKEVLRYENAAVKSKSGEVDPDAFVQFIFDNADINIDTIDGHNTFHCMGGIKSVTPSTSVKPCSSMVRMKSSSSLFSEIAESHEKIELKNFYRQGTSGLKDLNIEDLTEKWPVDPNLVLMTPPDMLWLSGKWLEIPQIPSWSAFMEKISQDFPYEISKIIYLPFVRLPASDYNCINSVLNHALKKTNEMNQRTAIVTFDQPLYAKAREIVSSSPELQNVIIRLGGFHMAMSFIGAIGHIMSGSGLQELWSLSYAQQSTEKMLSGHHFARAVRAHILTQTAVGLMILDEIEVTDLEKMEIATVLQDFIDNPPSTSSINSMSNISNIMEKFHGKIKELEKEGPTAKLWIQYFELVTLLRRFIQAERLGDFGTHLQCVQKMLPIFHSSGHFAYAKSAHLYLQDMLSLSEKLSKEEFDKFVTKGFFTIRRNDKAWAGIWSDMTIEQTLMRSMKTEGGLSQKRGLTDNVIAKWVQCAPALCEANESFEKFCRISSGNLQHIESKKSRIKRDNCDIEKFKDWFKKHPPFITNDEIMSLSTGIVGDGTVNCHLSVELGLQTMKNMAGKNFEDIKLSKKNTVRPLSSMNQGIKIYDTVLPVDTNLLYQRIIKAVNEEKQLKECFAFDLAPVPSTFFDESGMRKNTKADLYKSFNQIEDTKKIKDFFVVLDGGFLLHKAQWPKEGTFKDIFKAYKSFVQNNYGEKAMVVFDGYGESSLKTKNAERQRRSKVKKCADINFNADTALHPSLNKEKFLSNENNKSKLISFLMKELENSYEALQAPDDADILIVQSAIKKKNEDISMHVAVVGEDVDLLILIAALTPGDQEIYFIKPGKGKVATAKYLSTALQSQHADIKDHFLFMHAAGGCDSTSAFYKKGKQKFLSILKSNKDVAEKMAIFNEANAEKAEIEKQGELFVKVLYGGTKAQKKLPLNEFRYDFFSRSIVRSKHEVKLETLPPTSEANKQHFFRVYHQIQVWRGRSLPAEHWGWKIKENTLVPITTILSPAPDFLLHLITCACKKGCGGRCSCRRAGLPCTTLCANCSGVSCTNAPEPFIEEEEEEVADEDLDDPEFET